MRVSRSILVLAAMTALAAAPSGAQYVALDGSYGEANGQIVDIPNNQPQQFLATGCTVNSRCRGYKKVFPTQMASTVPQTHKRPVNGVGRIAPLPTIMGGMAVGASFKVPASFFGQNPAVNNLPHPGGGRHLLHLLVRGGQGELSRRLRVQALQRHLPLPQAVHGRQRVHRQRQPLLQRHLQLRLQPTVRAWPQPELLLKPPTLPPQSKSSTSTP
mgnify:CR=1 FL=1